MSVWVCVRFKQTVVSHASEGHTSYSLQTLRAVTKMRMLVRNRYPAVADRCDQLTCNSKWTGFVFVAAIHQGNASGSTAFSLFPFPFSLFGAKCIEIAERAFRPNRNQTLRKVIFGFCNKTVSLQCRNAVRCPGVVSLVHTLANLQDAHAPSIWVIS